MIVSIESARVNLNYWTKIEYLYLFRVMDNKIEYKAVRPEISYPENMVVRVKIKEATICYYKSGRINYKWGKEGEYTIGDSIDDIVNFDKGYKQTLNKIIKLYKDQIKSYTIGVEKTEDKINYLTQQINNYVETDECFIRDNLIEYIL